MTPFRFLPFLFAAVTFSFFPAQAQNLTLKSFDSAAELADLEVVGGQMAIKRGVLRLKLNPSQAWPQLRQVPAQPLNWSGYALSFEVKNTGNKTIKVGVRADDRPDADGWKGSWTGEITLPPGKREKVVFELGIDPMSVGMRGLPPQFRGSGTKTLLGQGEKPLDARNITSWQIFVAQPKTSVHLEIDNLALVPAAGRDLAAIVDEWGQYTRAEWPQKLKSDAELAARRDLEAKQLATVRPNPDLDIYGGWKRGPKLQATGFFRTQKVGQKWWLVSPLGHLFFSSGVAVVQSANPTIIAGRESLFRAVPTATSERNEFRGEARDVLRGPVKSGLTYDFARANLKRKYGLNWPQKWRDTTLSRLQNWGFNTLGNWTSDDLKKAKPRLPYVATAGIYGDHARLSDGDDYWGKMHDPFDPKFPEHTRKSLAEIREVVGNDPFCLGYFVENELSFGNGQSSNPKAYFGLVYGVLSSPVTQPAKRVFVANLRQKYGQIEKLNAAWNTKLASWETLGAPFEATETPNNVMKADFSVLLSLLADKYYATVAAQLKIVAPQHLYLGSRFSGRPPLEVARASAKHCDVVSFNIYAPQIDAQNWGWTGGLSKPIIIGEYHIGATDRGVWMPGLVAARDQKERAQTFKNYFRSVLANPNFVGCHWFQWADQPNTGRPQDGENYNIGFVDITDTPYPELVTAAKEVHGEIYSRYNRK